LEGTLLLGRALLTPEWRCKPPEQGSGQKNKFGVIFVKNTGILGIWERLLPSLLLSGYTPVILGVPNPFIHLFSPSPSLLLLPHPFPFPPTP